MSGSVGITVHVTNFQADEKRLSEKGQASCGDAAEAENRVFPSDRHLFLWRVGQGASRTCGVIALFTGPHHMSFSEPSSLTIRLSSGDRPVFAPEYAVKAPVEVMAEPVSYTRASSYSAATEGLAICRRVSSATAGI